MKFMVQADQSHSITVFFEPSGAQYVLEAGDYLTIWWPDQDPDSKFFGAIVHEAAGIVLSEPGGGLSRAWNSRGEEISVIG